MSATDELRRLLDEAGIEHIDFGGITEWTNGGGRMCRAYTRNEPICVDIAMLAVTPEQAIAATLGSESVDYMLNTIGKLEEENERLRSSCGTLTAEQVREAVMSADRWEKPMSNTGLTNTHLIIRDDGWQAIADELNAGLYVNAGVDDALAILDEIHYEDRISYDDYSRLFDAIAAIAGRR